MKGTKTKVDPIHWARTFRNRGPLCVRDYVEVKLTDYRFAAQPTEVTCKTCKAKLPSVGITGGSVRKLLPRHLGRLTEEERLAMNENLDVQVRDLQTMLSHANYHDPEIVKIFKHWLMDHAHAHRMRNQLDEQATVERIISKLPK